MGSGQTISGFCQGSFKAWKQHNKLGLGSSYQFKYMKINRIFETYPRFKRYYPKSLVKINDPLLAFRTLALSDLHCESAHGKLGESLHDCGHIRSSGG